MNDRERMIHDEKMRREPATVGDVLLLVGMVVLFFVAYAGSICWIVECDRYIRIDANMNPMNRSEDLYRFLHLLSVVFVIVGSYVLLVFSSIVVNSVNPHCVRLILRRSVRLEP
jgi:hypothetical protein